MKKIILTLILILISSYVFAEFTYNKPNVLLLDKDKNLVEGVTSSTDYARCLQKANNLGAGTYYCRQADIKVTVTGETQNNQTTVTVSWKAPTRYTDESMIKYGDIKGYKVYVNGEPVSVNGDKLNHELELDSGNYNFSITALVNGIESAHSNTVIKVVN